MTKFKKYFLVFLKIAISFGLLYWLINNVGAKKIIITILNADLWLLLLSCFLFVLITFILSNRWKYMSQPFSQNLTNWNLFKYYLYFYYFNNFLPTSIGGDIVRALKVGQDMDSRSNGLASVFIDRVMGIWATLTFATLGLYWTANYFKNMKIVYFAILFSIAVILLMNILLNPWVYNHFRNKLILKITLFNFGSRLTKVLDAVHLYRGEKKILFVGYILALLAQGLTVILTYVVGLALGVDMNLGYLFFAIPVSFLITLAPSINGIGWREGSYIFLLGKIGVLKETAFTISLLVLIVQVFLSIFGGIFWIFEKNKKHVEEMAEEV
ncbi:MAG: flippase-like domain-containing protein [Calditrichia bacterium]|nr:flippase-like domain-containing protein [Calditrichia bacterium]